ncbi:MAG TPA: hypothetical protein VK191_05530 [Symbiobacteriaceae bacterium]|nr:hypothetical protein [Symbiobacteriaceae bacterium]
MRNRKVVRLLGALLVIVGLGLGAVTPGAYVGLVGLFLGLAALLLLLRGRPAHLLPWAGAALLAVALQAFGPLPGIALGGGTGLLLWRNRAHLLPARLPRRRLLLVGLTLALIGLFLPWRATTGSFVSGYAHQLAPLTGEPHSVYDPLATWVPADQEPGRQLLGSLLPLLAWCALLYLAVGRPAQLRRLGPPLWLVLVAWWLLQHSILLGSLLYLSGTGLVGLSLIRLGAARPKGATTPAPGLRDALHRCGESCDWEG